MKAIGFKLVEVTNPESGEVKEKIKVVFDNCQEYFFLTNKSVEEIKASRSEVLSKITIREGDYGKYCIESKATLKEEF